MTRHTTKRQLDEAARRSRARTAQRHADGDRACGREWVCACATCRMARNDGFIPERRP